MNNQFISAIETDSDAIRKNIINLVFILSNK